MAGMKDFGELKVLRDRLKEEERLRAIERAEREKEDRIARERCLENRGAPHVGGDAIPGCLDVGYGDHATFPYGEATTTQQLPGDTRPGWRLPYTMPSTR